MSTPDPFADDDWPQGLSKTKPVAAIPIKSAASAKPDVTSFPVTWIDDAQLRLDTRPILKGLIEHGSFVLIYGPSGSGKSFFTADLAQHIATGQAWRGRRVQQSLVVYVASEAGNSIIKRFVAWRDNRLGETASRVPLAILTRGPNLLASVQVESLCAQLRELCAAVDMPLGLVVFDTLSRSMHGGDENTATDMTMVVSMAERLRDDFGAATAYVHHSGKDPAKGGRGHSSLPAAADLILMIDNHVATVEKVRDGVSGERFPFALEPVEVGTDSDGEPVITCLLNATDSAGPSKRAEPTGKNQRIVLKELRSLSPNGNPSPGTSEIPRGVMLVRFEDLAEKAVLKFTGMPQFKARGRITEALSSLQASGFVGVHGELVWLL